MNAKLGLATLCTAIALAVIPASKAAAGSDRPFVTITSPHMGDCVPGPNVSVEVCAGGICLQPCGNNVHFMLDDEPFEVQFDPNHPHIFQDVAPGTHTIRAYLANSMQEALASTLDVVTFSVAYPDDKNRLARGAAVLTYCLPQGEYLGLDCADVAVSFLVDGTTLSPGGYKVNYYVDGKRYIAYDESPRHLQGLAPGYHTVKMDLLDIHNNLVPGPFNSAERVILLSPDKSMATRTANAKSPELPTLSSIHGAMTMGMPTMEKEEPASPRVKSKSAPLTVKHETSPSPKRKDESDNGSSNMDTNPDSSEAVPTTSNLTPPTDGESKELDSLRDENSSRDSRLTPQIQRTPDTSANDQPASVSRAIFRRTLAPQPARISSSIPPNPYGIYGATYPPPIISIPTAQPKQVNSTAMNLKSNIAPTTDAFDKEIPNADDVATSETDPAPTGLFSPK